MAALLRRRGRANARLGVRAARHVFGADLFEIVRRERRLRVVGRPIVRRAPRRPPSPARRGRRVRPRPALRRARSRARAASSSRAAFSGSSASTSWSDARGRFAVEARRRGAPRSRSSRRRPAPCRRPRGGRRAASRAASIDRGAISRPDPQRFERLRDVARVAERRRVASRMRAICACDPAAVVGSWTSSTTPRSRSSTDDVGRRDAARGAPAQRRWARSSDSMSLVADVLVRRGRPRTRRTARWRTASGDGGARRRDRRRARRARREALHAFVVRRELRGASPRARGRCPTLPVVARDARHLLLDLDRLGGLADLRRTRARGGRACRGRAGWPGSRSAASRAPACRRSRWPRAR